MALQRFSCWLEVEVLDSACLRVSGELDIAIVQRVERMSNMAAQLARMVAMKVSRLTFTHRAAVHLVAEADRRVRSLGPASEILGVRA